MDPVSESHDLHGLLQPLLLLVHNRLDDHRARVHPRQRHEQRERSGNGHDELNKNIYYLLFFKWDLLYKTNLQNKSNLQYELNCVVIKQQKLILILSIHLL